MKKFGTGREAGGPASARGETETALSVAGDNLSEPLNFYCMENTSLSNLMSYILFFLFQLSN